jgi:hypothetical protein
MATLILEDKIRDGDIAHVSAGQEKLFINGEEVSEKTA